MVDLREERDLNAAIDAAAGKNKKSPDNRSIDDMLQTPTKYRVTATKPTEVAANPREALRDK